LFYSIKNLRKVLGILSLFFSLEVWKSRYPQVRQLRQPFFRNWLKDILAFIEVAVIFRPIREQPATKQGPLYSDLKGTILF